MKESIFSSDQNVIIHNPKAIALLMHPVETIYLKPFMTEALTVSEAASRLGLSLAFLYYRVKRFEHAGLLLATGERKRQGRPMTYYQASAKSFIVPFSATNSENIEAFLAAHDAHWQPGLARGLAAAYRASGLPEENWGVKIDMAEGLMMFDILPLSSCAASQVSPRGIINDWDTRFYLSDEDVEALANELEKVLQKYRAKHTGKRKVLRLALADWTET